MPNRKKVAIIMGSDSDWPVVKSACGVLKDFDVPFEAHILSAHRTPEAAAAFAKVQKAPGTAARQRQRRCQHKRRPSFFMHHFRPRSIHSSNRTAHRAQKIQRIVYHILPQSARANA